MIAGGGTDLDPGAPILLLGNSDGAELTRIPIDDVTHEYFKPTAIHWTDNARLPLMGRTGVVASLQSVTQARPGAVSHRPSASLPRR